MTTLADLLPGVREIRVPLTVGYVWLLTAWISFGDQVPPRSEVSHGSLVDLLMRLSDRIGTFGTAAALSVGAYLIGTLAQEALLLLVARSWKMKRLGRVISHRRRAWTVNVLDWADMAKWFNEGMAEKLQVSFRVLERGQAEASLRLQVALPLIVVAPVLLLEYGAWGPAGVALVGAVVFAWHGLFLLNAAKSQIGFIDEVLGPDFDRFLEHMYNF